MIEIISASQGRNGKAPFYYEGTSDPVSGALMDSRDQGSETVSYAHVEHVIIEDTADLRLPELLTYCFQNGEQSIEANVWLLREKEMKEIFREDMDLAKRLSTLKTSGAAGTSLLPHSLRQVAVQMADDGAVLIPALEQKGDKLVFDSYGVFRESRLCGFLEGSAARGAAILAGDSVYWSMQAEGEDGETGTAQLHSGGCKVTPQFSGEKLTGMEVCCNVDGSVMETWSTGEKSHIYGKVKQTVEAEIKETLDTLQGLGADATDLRRQAGILGPWKWNELEHQAIEVFETVPLTVSVRLTLMERF